MQKLVKFGVVDKDVVGHPELSMGAKALYSLLCCFKSKTLDQCFPSNTLLAEHLGCNERSVTRYFKELNEWGITSRRQTGYDSRYITSIHHGEKMRKHPTWNPKEGRQLSLPNK